MERRKRTETICVRGREYLVTVVERPFREGLELCCDTGKERIRVSDRGLGKHEAVRLLKLELERIS